MQPDTLLELAKHQAWADTVHWKSLHDNPALLRDAEIRKRLHHILAAARMLTGLAHGQPPDPAAFKDVDLGDELESAMQKANAGLIQAIETLDLEKMIQLPRGPQGPFEAPAGVLLLQAITHGQHHRGQNASRMRQLGASPPMTDFVIWYAMGRP